MCDTLEVLKRQLPGQKSYALGQLHLSVLGEKFSAHSAVEDVSALGRVLAKAAVTARCITSRTYTSKSAESQVQYGKKCSICMPTLTPLVKAKVISNSMACKIAGSGLMLCHLRMAHLRNETDGIAKLFAEAFNGK